MAQSVFPVPSAATPSLYSRTALITTSQTWAHPDGYAANRPVKVIIHGAGGGGGSGACGAGWSTGTHAAVGGYGGGSGYCSVIETVMTGDVSITIGAGGAGGASLNTANGDGNYGNDGGATLFGTYSVAGGSGGPSGAYYGGSIQEISRYAGTGGNVNRSTRFDSRYNSGTSGYVGYAANGIFGGGSYSRSQHGTGWSYGQAGQWSGSANGTDTTVQKSISYPDSGLAYLSGCGGAGGSLRNSNVATTSGAGNVGGSGIYAGGDGGYCVHTTTTTVPVAGAGSAGGLGAGGGGGGAASSQSAPNATCGAGGAGGSGYVRIFY
jgi:hypothetical protein